MEMCVELSTPFEQYYSALNMNLDEMQKLLENYSIEINEGILALARLEDLNKLETLWKISGIEFNNDIKVREYLDTLAKLIDGLRKNEEKFYEEVNYSTNPNFLLTTYYSLYLRYLTTVYAKLSRMRRVVARTKHSTLHFVNLIVGLLGMPILHYLKTKEVFPYISELSGVLLHALTNEAPIPSRDSLGYYLFSRIHAKNE